MDKDLITSQAVVTSLAARAQQGDHKAMERLRAVLSAERPDWENAITSAVDSVRQQMLQSALRDDLLLRETWELKAKALQAELEGDNPSPLERILCERVATCWLEQQVTDVGYHTRLRSDRLTFAQSSHWQRRQDRAHKRYLTACLALAKARRLLKPVIAQVVITTPAAPAALPPAPVVEAEPVRGRKQTSGLVEHALQELSRSYGDDWR